MNWCNKKNCECICANKRGYCVLWACCQSKDFQPYGANIDAHTKFVEEVARQAAAAVIAMQTKEE